MNMFKKPDPKEQMRTNQRELRRANRDLESDRRAMERREKELEAEIKKLAQKGQKDACTVLAKQLVQLRKQRTKSTNMSAQLTGINAQNSHMYSMGRMADAMGKTTATMRAMDKQMPATQVMKNMREFQMAQERMGMTEEMMNDAIDSIFDEPGYQEESDAIVNQVLDEIGIEMSGKMVSVPKTNIGASSSSEQKSISDADLDRMLAQLRS